MEFINPKYVDTTKDFCTLNKDYYRFGEDYDWVDVVDRVRGLEAIIHFLRARKTLKLIKKFKAKKKFLDVGCGTGLILRHLPAGSVGLDINPKNIERAQKHAPGKRLVEGDIEKMPFAANSFSTIICTDVLEHLPEPRPALKEIFRVLVKNGLFIGSVPAKNFIWKFRFLSSTHPGEPYHRLYTHAHIKKLLAGFGKILFLARNTLGSNYFFVIHA